MGPSKVFVNSSYIFCAFSTCKMKERELGRDTKDHGRSSSLARLTSPERQAPRMSRSPWPRDFNFDALSESAEEE